MNTSKLIELLFYLLPGVLVLASTLITLRFFLKKESRLSSIELALKNKQHTLPLRLTAYERLSIFLERITPQNLVVRLPAGDMDATSYRFLLINQIRSEFEHNLAQQVYVSSKLWTTIVLVKDEYIKNLNLIGTSLGTEASGKELTKALLTFYMENEHEMPSQNALDLLKKEVRTLF